MQTLTCAHPVISRPSTAALRPEDLAITKHQFEAWLRQAAPGDRIVYHRGYLALDRARGSTNLSEPNRRELVTVAGLASELAARGELHLVQCRHSEGDYSYVAVVASGRLLAGHRSAPAVR